MVDGPLLQKAETIQHRLRLLPLDFPNCRCMRRHAGGLPCLPPRLNEGNDGRELGHVADASLVADLLAGLLHPMRGTGPGPS